MSNQPHHDCQTGVAPDQIKPGQRLKVFNHLRSILLVEELILALDPWRRLRGLLGRPPLEPSQGILIRPCKGVHTCFMGYAIDVIFLDRRGCVVALRADLRPWRLTALIGEAYCVLELPAGRAAATHTAPGEILRFEEL